VRITFLIHFLSAEVPPYMPKPKDEAELAKLLVKEFTDPPVDPPATLPLRQIGFVGFTKTLKGGTGGRSSGGYQLNRTFNASSSLLETPENSFIDDKDEVCSRLQAELNTKAGILVERYVLYRKNKRRWNAQNLNLSTRFNSNLI